jgi:hypothetical protein
MRRSREATAGNEATFEESCFFFWPKLGKKILDSRDFPDVIPRGSAFGAMQDFASRQKHC